MNPIRTTGRCARCGGTLLIERYLDSNELSCVQCGAVYYNLPQPTSRALSSRASQSGSARRARHTTPSRYLAAPSV